MNFLNADASSSRGVEVVPRFSSVEEAQDWLSRRGIQYVLAQFVDIHGAPKAKSVPLAHLGTILKIGAGFAGFAICGSGMQPNDSDFVGVGDLSTLTPMPWQPGLARIVCDGSADGAPSPYDSRVALKRQVERAARHGWIVFTGLEPEFSLLRRSVSGEVSPFDTTDTLTKPCYDYRGLSRARVFLERLTDAIRAAGIDVYQIDHEDANGQFEINYTYTNCLTSCDRYILFKMAACDIASELEMICSFMPKPFSDRPGNGMHMHISIGDGTANLFADPGDSRSMGLSKLGYHFTAGLLRHASALAAICNPTVNSYKRLIVGSSISGTTWAPAYASYGRNNRSAMVRMPGDRIELRLPDSSCNPYLATAAVVAAGIDGIENELDAGAPINENLFEWSSSQLNEHGVKRLPQNLSQALDALEANDTIKQALGPVAEEFIKLKRAEWLEYMRHVSDWERQSYLQSC
ncbi:type III glutamate--ammonia ligase [Paraburkholderia kururiensis]|uniref:type III glutamate--ammonia ligase n=1 Tax=Paraburkholderia kururiensis TaxID=984307 RepID=UPI000F884A9D|nr:type III glutamate--ammonia ligase [Paraburkholderia kururiensis]